MRSVVHRLFGSASAVLIAVVITMAIGTFAVFGTQFHAAWRELRRADRLSELAAADRVIFQTTNAIRVDRGTAQTTLLAEDDPRAAIATIFANSDKQWDLMNHAIPPDLSDDTAARLTDLSARWSKVISLRDGVMTIAAKPRAERKLADTKVWFDGTGTVITGLTELSSQVAGAARIADPRAGEYIQVRQFAWAARLAVGDECGSVRSAFGGGSPLTPTQRTLVTEARTRAGQSMATPQELLSRPGAPADLVAAQMEATRVMRAAFTEHDAAYENLGTPKQLDGPTAEKQCVATLAPALKPGILALERLADYAADNRASALTHLAIAGALLVAVGLGILVSLLLVRGRIIRPVSQITAAIRRLAAHDIATPVAASGRDDKFGAMAAVLEELRLAAVEAERLVAEREAVRQANDRRQAAMDRHTQDFGQTIAGVMTSLMH